MNILEERTAQVQLLAIDVFEDEAKALRWLNAPRIQLNGRTPLSMIDTDDGFKEVICLLHRIDYGIFA